MQLQISSIQNGYLIASPKQVDEKQLQRMSPEQRQQFLSQPDCTYCEDYEAVCQFLKRFFFSGSSEHN